MAGHSKWANIQHTQSVNSKAEMPEQSDEA